MKLSSRVYQTDHHALLIDFLNSKFTYLSRNEWLARIADHRILVNENQALPESILRNGDIVSYEVEDFPEPDADLHYSVVYEDDWLVGVNKPGNLLVHKAGGSITRNLVFLLRHSSKNPSYEGIHSVNRLDRETSGVVLFSKDPGCLRQLHRDFASGKVEKHYTAIVHGIPKEGLVQLEMPIGQDYASAVHYKFTVDRETGKSACTIAETICSGRSHALLSVRPLTGRTHQIRVHLAAIGCPIVGDKLYGMPEDAYLAWRSDPSKFALSLEFKRQALHCGSLKFTHPRTGQTLTIDAPLPPDMHNLMTELGLCQDRRPSGPHTAAPVY